MSLYAALETATGRVHGKTAARHTSQDFVAFLEEVIAHCPARQQIHIILDNLSAHKTRLVDEFLQKHSRVHFHFTPTYSSWLNQVELWFGKIERDLIARGVFTSVNDLARKIRRYIKAYSANAKPIQWKYSDPTRRIRSNELRRWLFASLPRAQQAGGAATRQCQDLSVTCVKRNESYRKRAAAFHFDLARVLELAQVKRKTSHRSG